MTSIGERMQAVLKKPGLDVRVSSISLMFVEQRGAYCNGSMFWFMWKRLSGSQSRLTEASRL